jgi:hypothetical protein
VEYGIRAKQWMTAERQSEPVFYADGHVRVYQGKLTALPKHYVSRQRLYLRATVDYWINAMDGKPFLYINQPVDHGLVAALRKDLVPWMEANAQMSAEHRQRTESDPEVPRFTVIFDREGYSPELFEELWERRIAAITCHRYPKENWPDAEFREETVELVGGVSVKLMLAERKSVLGRNRAAVREVRRLAEGGRQISMVSTHPGAEGRRMAALLFARWSQENYFRYMRQHYGLDVLVERGTEEMPDTEHTVNPAWRKLNAEVRRKHAEVRRHKTMLAAASLEQQPIAEPAVTEYHVNEERWLALTANPPRRGTGRRAATASPSVAAILKSPPITTGQTSAYCRASIRVSSNWFLRSSSAPLLSRCRLYAAICLSWTRASHTSDILPPSRR